MATKTATANPSNKGNARLPPKRGQIKVRIISQFVKMVVGAASKAVRGLGRKKRVIEETQLHNDKAPSTWLTMQGHCDI